MSDGREKLELRSDADPAFRSIAENSPDNIMLLDREGMISYINRTVPDLTPDEVIGTSVTDHVPVEFREDIRCCLQRVLSTGEPGRYEYAYLAEDGTVSFWESRVAAVCRNDEVVGFAVTSSNVTERRAAAADRDRFFNLSADMLCVAGFDGYLKCVNPAFERALGHTEEQMLGRPFIDWVHPDDRRQTLAVFERIVNGESVLDFENRWCHADGSYRRLSWRAVVDPTQERCHAVARDITARRELEEQLLQSQKMDAVGHLAGGIAHDFNNMILAIQGNTEFVRTAIGGQGKAVEYLDEIERAAQRASNLTRQLLAFSRRQPMRQIPVDLNALIRDLMQLLRRLIPENIEIGFTPADGLPAVEVDPVKFEQVLVNLCVNARDAMPRGGRLEIESAAVMLEQKAVAARPHVKPGSYVVVRVTDTGSGMTPEVRERMFEPFFTTKETGKGTGLGLAVAYGVVEQHEGFIDVASNPGAGTRFEVFLPAAAKDVHAVAPPKDLDLEVAANGDAVVLVAEDDDMVRTLVVRILEDAGYQVLVARDGAEAVEVFEQNPDEIGLLLLDVIMPRLGGPAALARIRNSRPDLPALLTSGYHDETDPDVSEIDTSLIVKKPYDIQDLLRRVREALR